MAMFFERNPSVIGLFALVIWSFAALFATLVQNIPTFEMLTFVFSVSFLVIFIKVALFKEWYKFKQPLVVWFIGIGGIYGNDFFYYEAFKYAPASQIDIINYMWPIFAIILSTIIASEKIKLKHVIGCVISFFGVYVLIAADSVILFKTQYLPGYFYAFLDSIIWALYVLLCRRYKDLHSEVIGLYCGVCAILSYFGHQSTEVFVMPNISQFIAMFFAGISIQGLAYILWEQGIKKGNYTLLSTISYFTPILSIIILIAFGKASFTFALLAATLLVTAGAVIANRR